LIPSGRIEEMSKKDEIKAKREAKEL